MASTHGISLRTTLEYTAIIALLVALFGGSKIQSLFGADSDTHHESRVSQDQLGSLVYPDKDLHCPNQPLDIHIFSRSPLIIYISNFVSDEDSKHLVDIS